MKTRSAILAICMTMLCATAFNAHAKFGVPDRVGDRLSAKDASTYAQLKQIKQMCEDGASVLKRRLKVGSKDAELRAYSEVFDMTHVGHYLMKSPCYYEHARISGIHGGTIGVTIDSSQTLKAFDRMGSLTVGIVFIYDEKLDDWIATKDDGNLAELFGAGAVADTTVPYRAYQPNPLFQGQDNANMLSRVDETLTELGTGYSAESCSVVLQKYRGPGFGGRPAVVFEAEDPTAPGVALSVKKVATASPVKFYQEPASMTFGKVLTYQDVVAMGQTSSTHHVPAELCTVENVQQRELYRAHLRSLQKSLATERRVLSVELQSAVEDRPRFHALEDKIKAMDVKLLELRTEELTGDIKAKYF